MPSGAINAADHQLEEASSSCERWGIWCAALVVVAVIAEFVIAGIHPLYDSCLEQWGSASADAAVALGIVGEVLFSMKDARIQTELRNRSNKKLGEAEKAAAEARQRTAQIELLTAWRRVSLEQRCQIADAIRDEVTSSLDVLIENQSGDAEAYSYAFDLHLIFKDAGVEKVRGSQNSWLGWQRFGLHAAASAGTNLSVIAEAFAKAGMPLTFSTTDPSTGLPGSRPIPELYIFVAPKLPIHFESFANAGENASSNTKSGTRDLSI